MIDVPVKDLLTRCYHDLERTKSQIKELEERLNPGLTSQEIKDRLQANHPERDELQSKMRSELDQLRSLLTDKDLMTIPAEMPDVIISPDAILCKCRRHDAHTGSF